MNRATLKDLFHLLSLMTPSRWVNLIKLFLSFRHSVFYKKVWMWGIPWSLTLETNNTCNLHCPECITGTGQLTRKNAYASLEEIQTMISNIPSTVFYVNLYFLGEPLLHPEISQIIKQLKMRNIYVALSTNAQLLNDLISQQLVESGLDRLIISLDGFDQTSYSLYRRGGDFHKVTAGTGHILNARNNRRSSRPYIVLQTLLLKSTEENMDKIKELGLALGVDKHEFKTAWFDTSNRNPELVPGSEKYKRYDISENGRLLARQAPGNGCFRMWASAVITLEGKILPCCFDKEGEYELGDMIKEPLQNIWRGSEYYFFRKKIISGRNRPEICSNCTRGLSGIKRS